MRAQCVGLLQEIKKEVKVCNLWFSTEFFDMYYMNFHLSIEVYNVQSQICALKYTDEYTHTCVHIRTQGSVYSGVVACVGIKF